MSEHLRHLTTDYRAIIMRAQIYDVVNRGARAPQWPVDKTGAYATLNDWDDERIVWTFVTIRFQGAVRPTEVTK